MIACVCVCVCVSVSVSVCVSVCVCDALSYYLFAAFNSLLPNFVRAQEITRKIFSHIIKCVYK